MGTQKVIIASLNPAKINAVQSAFQSAFPNQFFEFEGVSVPSGVADQPMSNEETRAGALNRVTNAKLEIHDGDFYVGLEAGIEGSVTFAWMVIESDTHRGESRSASLMLPPQVLAQLEHANELGDVMDNVFGTENIKQKGGAISLLTQNQLTRSSVYHQALILALIPFTNAEHFPANL
ncbi:Phosphatase that hydrolyzes non-canonical purine nucleotides such as XTP and ITP to their respective diphosphate derivatives. Probably excludes non-canonical purines from DNA precursor pool [Vibrio sp. B1FLJ16]|uniref:inosine/xanthosine triphosphatase n=1 Tax=Vibrio sp. B1FLJ16 TaxID=2751178 RepID=UPI0015F44503|nr:inosine/xanthosine triphosphatase [Vibrio sp. B1FLJ16]CAD7799715.1 Phosphatase that hydrolyzes non-canonical purine nucleotides such as XTP and ITP to their respective diphosphate derivatives. Probably excludes non-canonical purines from DNA precursor pool [Vibrio sp. B1FLJ16]CAE6885874.1 Phosphatase that hydrolyzes non-canonical purine nucleotides such as XTP and ITP to their respective diphosphate derivatives. Probably excludes non-canonical purines from DNA precursor pool [Vibrio sp. B1FLJ1